MKTVTVVIATIADDAWLEEAVLSVSDQAVEFDYDIIVAFDGPVNRVDRAWNAHPRVRILSSEKNRGLATTLNWAIRSTDAEFIARLDADDRSSHDRLHKQVAAFRSCDSAVVVGSRSRRISSSGDMLGSDASVGVDQAAARDVRDEMARRNVLTHSSVMFSKAAFEKAGGYQEDLQQMEDYDLWLRMARLGGVLLMEDELVDYRVHDGQMTRSGSVFDAHLLHIARTQLSYSLERRVGVARAAGRSIFWLLAQYAALLGLRKRRYERR